MKKHPIGFEAQTTKIQSEEQINLLRNEEKRARKSLVKVYFSHRGTGWTYYNDSFDLKVGDFVYVEGKLEGYRGQVTEINYSFKIKLSDYKKVVAVVDTDIKGEFFGAGSHMVTFDRTAAPFSKVALWFAAPKNDEDYVTASDSEEVFPLADLSKMKISHENSDRGYDCFVENNVSYIELDNGHGRAIVQGSENYTVEFDCADGEISNLTCDCFCTGNCKHMFATMLQLKETLEFIEKNYGNEYKSYFAAMSKNVFVQMTVFKNECGKVSIGI